VSDTLIVVQGNALVLQTIVRDKLTGLPTDAATVLVTVRDAADVPVTGQTWPVSLGVVGTGAGTYRAQLSSGMDFIAGQTYAATFEITVAGVVSTFIYPVFVEPVGSTDMEPSSSVASPAYQPPPLTQLLAEAELAYHQMVLGKNIAMVKDQNGEEVQYSIASRGALAQYIASLKSQLKLPGSSMRPAGATFGPPSFLLRPPYGVRRW
jgi:hypothetical protein